MSKQTSSTFRFKHFSIEQNQAAMKVTLDACLFAAYVAKQLPVQTRIMDIGAGTGLLSLILAQQHAVSIDAVEVDQEAAQQAAINCQQNPVINVHHCQIQNFSSKHQYSCIISNPPFFTDHLPAHNPQRNLARHNQSLSFDQLCGDVKRLLEPAIGEFWILLPCNEVPRFLSAANNYALELQSTVRIRSKSHKSPHRQFLKLRLGQSNQSPQYVQEHDITVLDEYGYTPEFTELLKDYYLKL